MTGLRLGLLILFVFVVGFIVGGERQRLEDYWSLIRHAPGYTCYPNQSDVSPKPAEEQTETSGAE